MYKSDWESEDIYGDLTEAFASNDDIQDVLNGFSSQACTGRDSNLVISPVNYNQVDVVDEKNSGEKEIVLIKKEEKLYQDLVRREIIEKNYELNLLAECKELRREIEVLQNLVASKDLEISKLSQQNENLKKNICSLFKTAKSEIEQKNNLLKETNRKLDNFISQKYTKFQRNQHEANYVGTCQKSSKEDVKFVKRNNAEKSKLSRKRHLSPSDCKEPRHRFPGEREMLTSKQKDAFETNCSAGKEQTKTLLRVEEQNRSTLASGHFISEDFNYCANDCASSRKGKLVRTDDLLAEAGPGISDSSNRDSTKTNDLFYQLLPRELQQTFKKYEQKQVVSLNHLKQSFIIHCYSYFKDVLNSIKSDGDILNSAKFWNKDLFCNGCKVKHFFVKQNSAENIPKVNCSKDCEVVKNDVMKLYKYRKEKLPFLVKREFGFLKNSAII